MLFTRAIKSVPKPSNRLKGTNSVILCKFVHVLIQSHKITRVVPTTYFRRVPTQSKLLFSRSRNFNTLPAKAPN